MNFRTLDLNLLRVFDMLMVERNVTRAAAQLAMTQPAVSNALRRLRDATNEELFIAGPTGMTPTAHAEAVWPAVREALDGLRNAFDPQHFDPRRDVRRFVLAMADATASVLMPPLVAAFDAEQAQAQLQVLPLATRDPRPLLEQGQADIALGFFPDVEAALAAEGGTGVCRLDVLYECEYVCVMRRGHPLAGAEPLTLDRYCDARHVRVSFHGRVHGFVDEALARLGRQRRRRDDRQPVLHRRCGGPRLGPADRAAAQLRSGERPAVVARGQGDAVRAAAHPRRRAVASPT